MPELTLTGPVSSSAVFRALFSASENAFWLDGSGGGSGSGWGSGSRSSRMGDGRVAVTADASEGTVTTTGAAGSRTVAGDVLEVLTAPSGAIPWTGWLGYGVGMANLGLPVRAAEDGAPDAAFVRPDRLVEIDEDSGSARVRWDAGVHGARPAWIEAIAAATSASPPGGVPVGRPVRRDDEDAYRAMIEACLARIRAGDAYQLCLTTSIGVETRADPLAVFERLRERSPAPYAALVRVGGASLVSSSPELFLRIEPRESGGAVTTRPIKGTRPRGRTPDRDRALREELRSSEKERAENLMIVDLMRNDLSRVCLPGTTTVTSLFSVESHPAVHQLVSTVSGIRSPGAGVADVIRSTFPAGSMTGAPKRMAVEILDALEGHGRGVYAGCLGTIGADGAELAMVIRSIVMADGLASIGTGGGITSGSDPSAEVEETRVKARALLDALGAG